MRYSIVGATVDQVRSAGGTDIKEARSTGIIFATLTPEQADRLRSMGCTVSMVGKVEATVMPPPIVVPPVPVAAAPTYSPEEMMGLAGLEQLRTLTEPPLYGEGINLAIVDTGIRETHQKIKGRVIYSKNYTSDPMRDGFDHGTAVCAIALSMAPLCNILNLKVLDDKGAGTEEEVVLAIDDCITMHDKGAEFAPSVINLSLGAPDDGNRNNPLRVACRAAIDKGIWIFAAGGNSGTARGAIMSPACEKGVIAVGSIKYVPAERTFRVSDFSSRGPTLEGLIKPDTVFFGEDLIVASSSSDTATVAKSGTSFSTPFWSGGAIGYMEGLWRRARAVEPIAPGIPLEFFPVSPEQLIDAYLIYLCAKPVGEAPGKDYDYGFGMPYGPQVLKVLQLIPAMDISAILTPVLAIAFLGIIITPMAEAFR